MKGKSADNNHLLTQARPTSSRSDSAAQEVMPGGTSGEVMLAARVKNKTLDAMQPAAGRNALKSISGRKAG